MFSVTVLLSPSQYSSRVGTTVIPNSQYLLFQLRLGNELRNEIQADVHGGDPSHSQCQKLTWITLWDEDKRCV